MPTLDDVDVLGELVARGRVPAQIAKRAKLADLRAEAIAMVRDEGLVRARASWRIVPLDGAPGADGGLCVEGHVLQAPWLVPERGELTALACAVMTLGPTLERRVSELFTQRKAALAVSLDGVGNELLFALSRRVQDRMLAAARGRGLTMAGELRAGDPGLDLSAQQTVLELAQAAGIGVELSATLMMKPAKSASIMQGVGLDLPPQQWSRCDHCPSRERCNLARETV